MNKTLAIFSIVLCSLALHAQVTTSSITGRVSDASGQPIVGASVKAIHEPSGSMFGSVSNLDGFFVVPNVRIGGPYTIDVSSVGSLAQKISNVYLKLGEPYIVNVTMQESQTQLKEIVVTSNRTLDVDKVGASTNLNTTTFITMPTISRSITDFTRLTPQANGTSFAGRDNRYNNIQVDGANLNNNFGLSSDPLPGGGSSPISLDAYEEISVNIAPFDVRQSGFTGAGINAVTKSGTNTFKASAYTYFRNQKMLGAKVGDENIDNQIVKTKNSIYGFSAGGAIIKNKLFFFVNGEIEQGSRPGITFSPTGGSGSGNVSSTPIDSLRKLSNYLRDNFDYETGAFDNFPNFENTNRKLLAKVDYNINETHRLTFKVSQFFSVNDQQLNNTSVPNGGGFTVTGRTGSISRLPFNRFSNTSMSFVNSNYAFEDKVNTGTIELNSNFNSRFSNQLLATLTKIETIRTFEGPVFPTIDIFNGAGDNYMSAGMDPFTNNNEVVNDVITVTDNFTYYRGIHTITAGGSFEYQRVGNMFMAASNSYYVYNSLDDFVKDRAPVYYAYTYSLVPGEKRVFSAALKVGQLGIYAQDEISWEHFKVTYGIRADVPVYLDEPLANPAVDGLQFVDAKGNPANYSNGQWPDSWLMIAPRAGFRWDVLHDKTLVLRGGLGTFTGRIPFVYLTNMPTNSGMYQFGARVNDSTLQTIKFSSNPDAYADRFPKTAGASAPGNLVFIDPAFKFPQVFRVNIGADKTFGNGLTASLEALVTKDINAVRMRNANFQPTNGIVQEGGLQRPRYLTSADRNINPGTNTAIVLENVNKGHSAAFTAQLSKAYDKGLYGTIAYTYTVSKEVTANPGSQAASAWNANPNIGTSNAIELANSQYAIPHRVVANASYRLEYLNHFASTFSLFLEGAHQANYSFVVNGDLNGDGNGNTDLMYIPKDRSEMNFEEYTDAASGNTFTVAQQEEAFDTFINNSNYLRNHRGEYAQRNSALRPWYNRVDFRFLQDFFIETGSNHKRHTLQFSLDILNFGNLINKNWGSQQITTTTNPLLFRGFQENSPVFRWQQINGELVTEPFQDALNTTSTWSMQIGLRYIY